MHARRYTQTQSPFFAARTNCRQVPCARAKFLSKWTTASNERAGVGCSRTTRVSLPAEVTTYVAGTGKKLITFSGFGELGYQCPDHFSAVANHILSDLDPRHHIINSGTLIHQTMSGGIAEVLKIARAKGFSTASIHPAMALQSSCHTPSPCADVVFFVEDDGWGRIVSRRGDVSPSLEVLLELSAQLFSIGGGRYAADELRSFQARGKPVGYFPMSMNRAIADQWYRQSGIMDYDYRGDAHLFWLGK